MLLIVGVLIVAASVTGGYLMHGGQLLVLNQPSEFLIIGGAAIGSLLISTPMVVVKHLFGQLAGLFKAPLFGAAYLFNAPLSKAVRTVDALREKQESAS